MPAIPPRPAALAPFALYLISFFPPPRYSLIFPLAFFRSSLPVGLLDPPWSARLYKLPTIPYLSDFLRLLRDIGRCSPAVTRPLIPRLCCTSTRADGMCGSFDVTWRKSKERDFSRWRNDLRDDRKSCDHDTFKGEESLFGTTISRALSPRDFRASGKHVTELHDVIGERYTNHVYHLNLSEFT